MKKTLFCLLLIIYNHCFSQELSKQDSLSAAFDYLNNEPFKALLLEDTTGHFFNSTSLYGKTIYVDFWFTSCPPCLKEIPYSQSLQQFFAADTNIVFLNICIDNTERKKAWKQMIHDKKWTGIHLFYERNKPQKVNLLREYDITFPNYLLVNKEMKVIGYNAPEPSEEGFVHWAILRAEQNMLLSESYKELLQHTAPYDEFINASRPKIISLRK